MALSKDVEFAVETLIDLGVLNEEGLKRLAGLFHGLQALSGAFDGDVGLPASPSPKKGFYAKANAKKERQVEEEESEPGIDDQTEVIYAPISKRLAQDEAERAERNQDAGDNGFESRAEASSQPSTGYVPRKRAPKGSFNPTKLELQNLRDGGMTVKQIAELKDVSPATVNNKLREYGLTVPRKTAD